MYSEFCAILKNVPFKIKTDLVTFWGTFEKIGLLLISASGHTSYFFQKTFGIVGAPLASFTSLRPFQTVLSEKM